MAEGGDFEMGELGRGAGVDDAAAGTDETVFGEIGGMGDDVGGNLPDVPVNAEDNPEGWAVDDTVGNGDPATKLALINFEKALGVNIKDPNLKFRYNTKTKDLVVWSSIKNRYLRMSYKSGTKFYLQSHYRGGQLEEKLGFNAQPTAKRRLPLVLKAVTALPNEPGAFDRAVADADTAVKTFVESVGTNTEGLPMRELAGLDEAVQRSRGALTDNLAKLKTLDDHIAVEERKLNTPEIGEETRNLVRRRLQELRDERTTRLEAASANREDLRGQINRIRETIEEVLNADTTLGERLRTLFREQGVTIASLLTALGFIISTIVLAVTGGGAPVPAPTPTPTPGGAKEWIKKQLQALGEWLKALAGKAAAALPGIIGAAVSWLLKTAGAAAVWFAEHLWAVIVVLVGAALAAIPAIKRRVAD